MTTFVVTPVENQPQSQPENQPENQPLTRQPYCTDVGHLEQGPTDIECPSCQLKNTTRTQPEAVTCWQRFIDLLNECLCCLDECNCDGVGLCCCWDDLGCSCGDCNCCADCDGCCDGCGDCDGCCDGCGDCGDGCGDCDCNCSD